MTQLLKSKSNLSVNNSKILNRFHKLFMSKNKKNKIALSQSKLQVLILTDSKKRVSIIHLQGNFIKVMYHQDKNQSPKIYCYNNIN